MTLAPVTAPWLTLALATLQAGAPEVAGGPPGTVLVAGGRTTIGSTTAEIESLVRVREELGFALAGETPQFELAVEGFFLMPTEVTNEQYLEFVKATGSRPPRSWGARALQAGQAAFLEEQGRARQAAKKAGLPFELQVFDPVGWWDGHWRASAWSVPEQELAHPVVFVDFDEAEAYARWAGLRLMTEFEFQRAARGDSRRVYPWGDRWDDKKFCHSLHSGRDVSVAVGSYPAGASGGIHDLAGNVWEWTASPFTAYPGHQALRIVGKARRVIDCLAPFDPEQKVTVGGSFQMDRIGVRIATRRNTDRTQSTNALGFRCAASTLPGLDVAERLVARGLDLAVLGPAELAPREVVALRRWSVTPAAARVPGYAVVRTYDHVLCCPLVGIPPTSTAQLNASGGTKDPVFLGFVDVTRPLLRPALDPGAYFVAWRAGGAPPPPKDRRKSQALGAQQGAHALGDVAGFMSSRDCFLFYDSRGVLRGAEEAGPVTVDRPRPCSLRIEPRASAEASTEPAARDRLLVTLALPSTSNRSKCFLFELALEFAAGTLDADWK